MASDKPDCPLCRDGVPRTIDPDGNVIHVYDNHENGTESCSGPTRQGERRRGEEFQWRGDPNLLRYKEHVFPNRRRPNSGKRKED